MGARGVAAAALLVAIVGLALPGSYQVAFSAPPLRPGLVPHDSRNVELVGMVGDVVADAVDAEDGYAYIADGLNNQLVIVDVRDPAHIPTPVRFDDLTAALDVAVAGDRAYVAGGYSGLRILNIWDPQNPTALGTYSAPNAYVQAVAISGTTSPNGRRYAYIAEGRRGIGIVDVTYADDPHGVTFFDLPTWYPVDVIERGGYLYVASGRGIGVDGLYVLDLSNPTEPVEIGRFSAPGTNGIALNAASRSSPLYAYLPTEDDVLLLDVSNPRDPRHIGTYGRGGERVAVDGAFLYLTTGGLGGDLYIADVSEPTRPCNAGFYETPATAKDVTVDGDHIYVADSGGLLILRLMGDEPGACRTYIPLMQH